MRGVQHFVVSFPVVVAAGGRRARLRCRGAALITFNTPSATHPTASYTPDSCCRSSFSSLVLVRRSLI